MSIFEVASRHMDWVSARQSVIASNIANVDTPGFKAKDVVPFAKVMDSAGFSMVSTAPGHLREAARFNAGVETVEAASSGGSLSGNTVVLESELLKSGENSRQMSLDTGLTRIFHRMILTSLKV